MNVTSKINYIVSNIQQTNTLLASTVSAEDAIELQVFKTTAGEGSGMLVTDLIR